jgi:hypothetical protein
MFPIDPHLVYCKELTWSISIEDLLDALGVVMGMASSRQV